MPDFTGRVVNHGRLQLLESLGSGAYGKVYRALDTASSDSKQKFYAVKCLNRPAPGSHAELLQQREFSLHRRVTGHPNIVGFHGHFSDEFFVYVILDLMSGGDLFAAITEKRIFRDNGPLIKRAFIQLIDAVQYCHDAGVFHRDIKPENVLCSVDGTHVRLADFGLSIQSPVCHDFGCGSSYYMSPECIGREINTGEYSTRHNDVWALGVILTNMITGRNPWRYATSDDDCFSAYLHDNDFLRQVLPISEGVNKILKQVFTINPLRRISLPELRKEVVALDAFFAHEQTSARVDDNLVQCTISDDSISLDSRDHCGPPDSVSNSTLVTSTTSSKSSDESYVFASPVVEHLPGKLIDSPAMLGDIEGEESHFVIRDPNDSLSVPSSGSSGSSRPESKGPITPDTHPIDPAIDIPDIPEEEGLGPPASIMDGPFVMRNAATPQEARLKKKGVHILRSAVQRIKAISTVGNSS
ncbi:kinase-like domain-containing protein [Panaeolus papilionaceus]|nr:kinase-like domain-containing protein [Panaeolus papilionaceus]